MPGGSSHTEPEEVDSWGASGILGDMVMQTVHSYHIKPLYLAEMNRLHDMIHSQYIRIRRSSTMAPHVDRTPRALARHGHAKNVDRTCTV